MKFGLYPRLALAGIRKNKRLYIPYLLTCTGMAMMYYIIIFLQHNEMLDGMRGGTTASTILALGGWVVAIFACIFLFYTHSFLLRRRKKEFGLYNILGMGRRHLVRIEIWETIFVAIGTTAAGLLCGIAFSKLAELGLMNLMHGSISYVFSISAPAIMATLLIFGVIHLLLLLRAAVAVGRTSAIQLLQSEAAGEKPPRANWFLGLLGVILLGVAYYMAVTIKEPLMALALFFVAVVLVILATYLIMISGSVLLCRQLQKNTAYYYNPRHFVSVSSMAYRMKRNGAGLASVCILATMVLVMISSTTCLYFGQEDAVNARYPHDLTVTVYGGEKLLDEKEMAELRQGVENTIFNFGGEVSNVAEYRELSLNGLLDGGNVLIDSSEASVTDSSHAIQVHFVPLEEYNALTGQSLTLEDGQVYVATLRMDFDADTLSIDGGMTRHVMKREITPLDGAAVADITPSLTVVVRDFEQLVPELQDYLEGKYGWHPIAYWNYGFDTDLPENQQANVDGVTPNLKAALYEYLGGVSSEWGVSVSVESKAENRADFYGTYGGLFFLGIMLSIVFIFAAVAILYYKQLSEGYEDQSRFDIMQKVGMTKGDIRRSINSQLLTVFSLPLLMAGVHLCFAFPFIHKLLMLFNLDNRGLLIGTTAVSFAVFAALYALVYKLTGNAYYHIVADNKE